MVSIVTTVYNHEPYLRQCLNGIVMQQTKFRFEAIVHDDVSTDGSVAIIKEYAEKYPDIIKPIYETENQYSKGDGSLGRILKNNVRGKYVATCEGDDYWIDADKLQNQFDYMESHPEVSMCGTNGLVLYDDHSRAPIYFSKWFREEILDTETIFSNQQVFHTCSYFYRRELLEIREKFNCRIFAGDLTLKLLALSLGDVATLGTVSTVYRKDTRNAASFTQTHDCSGKWAIEQLIHLYTEFDKFTNGRFHSLYTKRMKDFSIRLKALSWRKRLGRLALIITYPAYNWPNVYRSVLNKLHLKKTDDYFFGL